LTRAGLAGVRIGGLTGRALEEGIVAGLSEQRFDLSQEFPVVAAGMLEEGGPLAGILIETVWTTADATAVVIGFGINVRGAEAVAAQVDALRAREATLASGLPPAALSIACASANLTDTLAASLNALTPALAQFGTDGLAPVLPLLH
jgi:BirA family biotin operon repressor/biotin-[acetyl-CoA-carboxylase] ligase